MLWTLWRQHRADRQELKSIQRYLAHRRELLAPVTHDVFTPGDTRRRGNTVNDTDRDSTGR